METIVWSFGGCGIKKNNPDLICCILFHFGKAQAKSRHRHVHCMIQMQMMINAWSSCDEEDYGDMDGHYEVDVDCRSYTATAK